MKAHTDVHTHKVLYIIKRTVASLLPWPSCLITYIPSASLNPHTCNTKIPRNLFIKTLLLHGSHYKPEQHSVVL